MIELYDYYVIVQENPNSRIRVRPEFWRDRDDDWKLHFVSMRSTRYSEPELVPILFQEYRSRPTVWPQGITGKFSLFK